MHVAFSLLLLVIIVIQFTVAAPVKMKRTKLHLSEEEKNKIIARIHGMGKFPCRLPGAEELLSLVDDKILPHLNIKCGQSYCTQTEYGIDIVDSFNHILSDLLDTDIISRFPSMRDSYDIKVAMAFLGCLIKQQDLQMVKVHQVKFLEANQNKLSFLREIRHYVAQKKKYQMLYHLYESRITPDEMIILKYQEMKNQGLSFDLLCQFITEGETYAQWSYYVNKANKKRYWGFQPSLEEQNMAVNNALSKVYHDSTSMNVENCEFFLSNGDVSDIISKTSEINQKLKLWQKDMDNRISVDLQDFTSWLNNEVIPYMKNVGSHLYLLYQKDNIHESALTTVDKILFLLKDAVLPHQYGGFFYFKLPDGFRQAWMPRKFFDSLDFFEFGVEFHTLLVKNKYLRLQMTSGDLGEKLKELIQSKESVKLIKKFQSPMKVQIVETPEAFRDGSIEIIFKENEWFIEKNFYELLRKEKITSDDVEWCAIAHENPLHVLWLDYVIGRSCTGADVAVDLLGVENWDVFYSSQSLLNGLKDPKCHEPIQDKFSLFQPRSKEFQQRVFSKYELSL